MQDPSASVDISITPPFHWLKAFLLVLALSVSGVAVLAIASVSEGETGCGGG